MATVTADLPQSTMDEYPASMAEMYGTMKAGMAGLQSGLNSVTDGLLRKQMIREAC